MIVRVHCRLENLEANFSINRLRIIDEFPGARIYIPKENELVYGILLFALDELPTSLQDAFLCKMQEEGIVTSWETVDVLPQPELHILEEADDHLTIRLAQSFGYRPRMTVATYEGVAVKISNMVSERYSDAYQISLTQDEVALLQAGFVYWNKKQEALGLGDLDEHPF